MPASSSSFQVDLSFQGTSTHVTVTATTTGADLHRQAVEAVRLQQQQQQRRRQLEDGRTSEDGHAGAATAAAAEEEGASELRLLYRGRQIADDDTPVWFAPPTTTTDGNGDDDVAPHRRGKKPPKIVVMATRSSSIRDLQTKRSDPTLRGLDQEIATERQRLQQKQQQQSGGRQQQQQHWADGMAQSRDYKFCRFEACTWQSFGHRPTDQTPHAFRAMELLEKLATDPGIVAVMTERELVVGTLGEMDPIDDRLMLQKQQQQQQGGGGGGCLLGYNTNAGARIDLKLRTDDLRGFRPYPDLAATLIHELSHNWCGEHDLLFWTNYAQMRAEYLHTHARLRSTVTLGKTTAELAGLDGALLGDVYGFLMQELVPEMGQFGLHPGMIQAALKQRLQELEESHKRGQRLGGGGDADHPANGSGGGSRRKGSDARELALAAAERRAREQQEKDRNQR